MSLVLKPAVVTGTCWFHNYDLDMGGQVQQPKVYDTRLPETKGHSIWCQSESVVKMIWGSGVRESKTHNRISRSELLETKAQMRQGQAGGSEEEAR